MDMGELRSERLRGAPLDEAFPSIPLRPKWGFTGVKSFHNLKTSNKPPSEASKDGLPMSGFCNDEVKLHR